MGPLLFAKPEAPKGGMGRRCTIPRKRRSARV